MGGTAAATGLGGSDLAFRPGWDVHPDFELYYYCYCAQVQFIHFWVHPTMYLHARRALASASEPRRSQSVPSSSQVKWPRGAADEPQWCAFKLIPKCL